MAIAQVQAPVAFTGSSSTASGTFSATGPGNFLIAAVVARNTVSTPSGWTLAVSYTAPTTKAYLFYQENCSSGVTSFSATLGGSAAWVVMLAEYSGVATSGSIDQTATDHTGGGSSTTGTITTTTSAQLLIGVIADDDNDAPFGTPTNSFALLSEADNGFAEGCLLERIVSSTGTYSSSMSSGGGDSGLIASFKAASGGDVTVSASSLTGTGSLPAPTIAGDALFSVSSLAGSSGFAGSSSLSLDAVISGVIPFSGDGVIATPDHVGPDGTTVTVTPLSGAGALSDGVVVITEAIISAGALAGTAGLGDNPVAAEPLIGEGTLGIVSIEIPPDMIVGALPLVGSGVLPSVTVGYGLSFGVSSLSGSGTLPAVSIATAGNIDISVSPLVGNGTLPSVATWLNWTSPLVYTIYTNDGAGGPIDYATAVAQTQSLTWTSDALAYAGDHKFGVRVSSLETALEEKNIDAMVRLILNASGADITSKPSPPTALRVFPLAGGGCRVEWSYPYANRTTRPTGFRVYSGTSGSVNYGSVQATVTANGPGGYSADLTGFSDGVAYSVGVRAYNATSEETNTTTADFTADATGPAAVASLTATGV